jgi:hypothetical protein
MQPFIDIGAPPRICSYLALATKALAKPDENLASKARLTTLFYGHLDAIFTTELHHQGRDLLGPCKQSSSPLHTKPEGR